MTLSSEALLHMRPGRKRIGDRRAGAERDHRAVEPEHVIKSVAIAQRTRAVGKDNAADALAGHCLGRLLLNHRGNPSDPMSISATQYGAGDRFAGLAVRHAVIQGYATGSPRSAALELVGAGSSCRKEPDEEYVIAVRRGWSDAYRMLMDAGREVGRGAHVAIGTYDIVLERKSYDALDRSNIGDLRIGLNALIRLWK